DLNSPLLLFTVTKRYEALAWVRGADRFSPDAAIFVQDANGRHALVPGFAASADPAVSLDGNSVLFAGKQQAQDHWQIWEIELEVAGRSARIGTVPRRVTSCAEDCVRPFYLPADRIVYARKTGGRFVIEAADLVAGRKGSSNIQLTYGLGNYFPTDVLRDGRILFEATYPLGTKDIPEIYTVYSDGSGVESYRCDHGRARYAGRQIASGDVVFASGTGVSGSGLGRFTSARAQEVRIPTPAGEYAGDIAETPSDDWLIAWRPHAKDYFQVKRWTPGDSHLASVVAEETANVVQPTLIIDHAVPKRHPSGLHDWPNANLLCLNAYKSRYKFAAGSIHSVRLYIQNSARITLLGTALVERDGSFFLQVPTEQPLQIELLDRSGRTLKREAGWFWMRRGEQRACVGCHAGPETAPENAVPMILLKSTTPADMTGAKVQAASGGHSIDH
ncbi:MAG: hypothetical protein WBW53_05055, partial [Terriglobales bacterium]